MKLVEVCFREVQHCMYGYCYVQVVRTDEISEDSFTTLMEFGKAVKKTPVSCKVHTSVIAGL